MKNKANDYETEQATGNKYYEKPTNSINKFSLSSFAISTHNQLHAQKTSFGTFTTLFMRKWMTHTHTNCIKILPLAAFKFQNEMKITILVIFFFFLFSKYMNRNRMTRTFSHIFFFLHLSHCIRIHLLMNYRSRKNIYFYARSVCNLNYSSELSV